jgi:hypothetical protein
MAEKLSSAAAIAKALGITQARVSQLRKHPWFPKPGSDGWDLDEVRQAIAANRRRYAPASKKEKGETAPPAESSREIRRALPPTPQPFDDSAIAGPLRVLEDTEASALDHARAARKICAVAFARAASRPEGMGKAADELKKALEEQRRAEKGWLDLERQKGQLIQRSAAIRVATELARQAATTMDAIEAQIASQVEVWIGDREFMDGDALTRQRRVISFFDRCARRVREANADTVETMIAQSQGDVAPDLDDDEEES